MNVCVSVCVCVCVCVSSLLPPPPLFPYVCMYKYLSLHTGLDLLHLLFLLQLSSPSNFAHVLCHIMIYYIIRPLLCETLREPTIELYLAPPMSNTGIQSGYTNGSIRTIVCTAASCVALQSTWQWHSSSLCDEAVQHSMWCKGQLVAP